jgi:lysophospholipase L1-like esterase
MSAYRTGGSMRRTWKVASVTSTAAAVAVGGAMAAAPAFAAPPVHYVALGDSYSSGVGTRDYFPDSGTCFRGPKAYPQLWADAHHPATFAFAACSGATTDDVNSNQVGSVSADTTLVTISIGGNDVGFTSVLTRCLLLTDSVCENAVHDAETKVRDELPAKLDATYAKIRAAASHAKVVVVGYPRLNTLGPCDIPGYTDAKRASLNAGADVLAATISNRAAAAGFSYADPRQEFNGHGVCSSTEWINGPSVLLLESFHPNVAGHADGFLPTVDAITG